MIIFFALPAGVVEISPSPVAAVCQEGDQLELICTSLERIHRWEVTVMIPQTMSFALTPLSYLGPGGTSQQVTINNSTFTTSRLSSQDSLPLMTRMVVNPVNANLNGAVVNCFEGSSSLVSVATTTIRIIDPGQFGKMIIMILEVG